MTRSTNSGIYNNKLEKNQIDQLNKEILKSKKNKTPVKVLPQTPESNLVKDETTTSQLLPLPRIITRQRRSKSEKVRQKNKTTHVKISKSFNDNPQLEVTSNSEISFETKRNNVKVEIVKPPSKNESLIEKTISTSLISNENTNHINDKTGIINANDADDEFIVS